MNATLARWLDTHADALDAGTMDPAALLPALADAGAFRVGVPASLGGNGGTAADAIEAIAAVSAHSQAAGFVYWAQRVFIEYLLQSPNRVLTTRWLDALFNGTVAGATGLSNAMKFLGGIEALQVDARQVATGWSVDGQVPWATNLAPGRFAVAVAANNLTSGRAAVYVIPHDAPGVTRSDDLDLVGLRGTHTASLRFTAAALGDEYLLHEDAQAFLPRVRPAFLGMQCALSVGLARRCIAAARSRTAAARSVLEDELDTLADTLEAEANGLCAGVDDGTFLGAPHQLFGIRIRLVDIAMSAAQLELQARGGAGYLNGRHEGFARRWREAAFLPIVTPSLVQLRAELARQTVSKAA